MSKTCKGCLYEENNTYDDPCNTCSANALIKSDVYNYVNENDFDKDNEKSCGNCKSFENEDIEGVGWCKDFYRANTNDCCERWESEDVTDISVGTIDEVNNPKHYKQLQIECKDVIKYFDACRGQAIKYIWRCEHKGKPIQDLKKAIFWLNEKIKMYESEGYHE